MRDRNEKTRFYITHIVKFLGIFTLILTLSGAEIVGLRPFGYVASLAIIIVTRQNLITLISFTLSCLLIDVSPLALTPIGSLLIVSAISYALAKAKLSIRMGVLGFSGIALSVVSNILSSQIAYFICLSVLLSVIFLYAVIMALLPITQYKLRYRLTAGENACLSMIVMVLAMSLSQYNIYGAQLLSFFGYLFLLFAIKIIGAPAVIIGLLLGLGASIGRFDISFIAMWGICACVAVIFRSLPRVVFSISGIVGYLMIGFYFEPNYMAVALNLIGMGLAGVVFSLTPKNLLAKISYYFGGDFSKLASRYIVNKCKEETATKLSEVANVFGEMQNSMFGLKGDDETEIVEKIADNLYDNICANCSKLEECKASGLCEELHNLATDSLGRGKATIMDIKEKMLSRCNCVSALLTSATALIAEYEEFVKLRSSEESAKVLLSRQLDGLTKVLFDLATKVKAPLSYADNLEKRIVEELAYYGVVCSEAVVTDGDFPRLITLICRSECYSSSVILKATSNIMREKMAICGVIDSEMAGWSIVNLRSLPVFDVVFSHAGIPKDGYLTSGDTHSFIRLSSHRFLLALCDGMGNGEKAFSVSESAISLVESFYKAGFDSEIALSSVNRFLTLTQRESFSALDIAVIDLQEGYLDIIKIGSPDSYIRSAVSTAVVEGGALPIGVVEEIKPKITRLKLSPQDMIVLVTDGISEAFSGNALQVLINNMSSSPELVASEILATAVNLSKEARDDMSVVVARLFYN